MIRQCDISRNKPIRYKYIEPGEYIEVNKKTLKVFAVFSKKGFYYYLAKIYESSNHYFLVSDWIVSSTMDGDPTEIREIFKVISAHCKREEAV